MTKASNTIVGYERDFPELDDRDATERPTKYLRKKEGTDDFEVVDGRRPSRMLLVNKLRDAVDDWRARDYPGASTTTYELFHHWFSGGSFSKDGEPFSLYWGQREAVETLAYLIEVEGARDVQRLMETYAEIRLTTLLPEGVKFDTDMEGIRRALVPKENGVEPIRLPPENLPRFACKMATGSGKTLVMALVILWSYFHARREASSPLATNFLVLAPNVIVFERLRVDFENGRVFRELPLVPPGWKFDLKIILRGEASEPGGAGNLFVTNIQQLYEGRNEWTPTNAIDALLGRKPTGNAATQGRSMLDRVRSLDRLLVCNDEAHHVHDDDLEWNKTLLNLHESLPHGLAAWLDFSATPRLPGRRSFPVDRLRLPSRAGGGGPHRQGPDDPPSRQQGGPREGDARQRDREVRRLARSGGQPAESAHQGLQGHPWHQAGDVRHVRERPTRATKSATGSRTARRPSS